jgi:lysozyme
MTPSPASTSLMHQFEGYARKLPDGRCQAYPDPGTGGKPYTIGWGSTTDEQGKPIAPLAIWTRERADARFAADVAEFARGVARLIEGVSTTQHEFDALVSFAYNVGLANLKSSTLLKLHRAGDKAGAAAQFVRWNKAAGKVLAGLTRRREAEAALYRGGAR